MMGSTTAWDGQDQHMTSGNDDDFNHFFNISTMDSIGDAMNFDYNGFQDGPASHIMPQAREPGNVMMAQPDPSSLLSRTDAVMQSPAASALASSNGHPAIAAHMMGQPSQPDSISNIDAQIHYLQQQKLRQQQQQQQHTAFFSHNQSVPPTPQSMELPPNIGQYYSQAEQMTQPGVFDYQQRAKEQQDLAFTPFVSPAATPLETHFNIDGAFANPGTYFSPLTSPALHAQNDVLYDHSTHSNNSPVEMDLEMPPTVQLNNSTDLAKKARKHSAAKARAKTSIKNSPISKPIRRKAGPSPAIVSQVLNEVDEGNSQSIGQAMLPLPASSTDGSEENASVSPENLTDMPPPPVPARRSASKSPYIQAQNSNATPVPAPAMLPIMAQPNGTQNQLQQPQQPLQAHPQPNPHPATPASLMKLASNKAKKPLTNQQEHTATDHIESLELPESISKPSLPAINTQTAAAAPSPDTSRPKSATFQPLPSPVTKSMGASSVSQSPQLRPGTAGSSVRKTPQLSSRNSRKRSTGSVHVSPALLPRISPNIKPLLPGTPGMSAEDTASRMLSAKSNYQHILEGNHVPGVSYPSELSTNLTSKRTSHKIAEQGRRNRINSALQEMAGLLPDQSKALLEEGDKKDAKGNTPNSKASVVENAIIHLKNLEQENVDLKQELQKLKQQLENLHCPTVEEEGKES
ncbi:hypothetical protein S7711_05300 [Stachybotrys chartarum IBT 7711]|uniref:BHLH domain-containing protein n=1 Tax=Stachybotrys chartarum (strain CBS 109288 / IBT 7711) TaxID=1280523 RepID=A0A084ALE9_STACB|nr:hypothetical protein S7711_05300 [Stachybotrys chartarum IBT 7711]KFA50835.1 hypothetical protein S40293_05808 [Stachybotrys chartarum IBT 40293]KFA73350.1 hypothetical protein S40288_03891 [Stachybotrys chartarum IBT 40288]